MSPSDVLLHPMRLRIGMALAGRTLTVSGLREALPDIPQATLYRHVKTLEQSGLIRVSGERRVSGAIERFFELDLQALQATEEELEKLDRAGHERLFGAFAAALMANFRRYLDSGPADLRRDGVGLRTFPLNLAPDELESFASELRALLQRYGELGESARRRRRTFSFVLLPDGASNEERTS